MRAHEKWKEMEPTPNRQPIAKPSAKIGTERRERVMGGERLSTCVRFANGKPIVQGTERWETTVAARFSLHKLGESEIGG
jgi:hypothetical protein